MPNPKSTKLVTFGPTVAFRVSAIELDSFRSSCFLIHWYLEDLLFPLYDSELAEHLQNICHDIFRLADNKKCQIFRIHADALALAAIMLGLRRIPWEARRHRAAIRWPDTKHHTKLLKRLEHYRRRAKRRWFRVGSAECYREYQVRWQRFLKGVHFRIPREKDGILVHHQKNLNAVLKIVKELLPGQNPQWIPLDPELRPMVRAAIHHVKRERAPVTMKDLLYGTPDGRAFLSEYVGRLVMKRFWQKMNAMAGQPSHSNEEDGDDEFIQLLEAARDAARAEAIRQNKV